MSNGKAQEAAVQDEEVDGLASRCVKEAFEDVGALSVDGDQHVVLRCESRAEEWHFDELLHRDEVRAQERLNASLRSREQEARSRKQQVENGMEAESDEILAASNQEDLSRCKLLSLLREELVETVHDVEQINDETFRQISSLHQAIEAERQRGEKLKEEVATEKQKFERAKLRFEEIDAWKAGELQSRRAELQKVREKAQRVSAEVQAEMAEQVKRIEARMQEELQALQQASSQVIRQANDSIDGELSRRRETMELAERDVAVTDQSISADVAAARQEVADLHLAAEARVKQVQMMDFEHERVLRSQVEDLWSQKQESLATSAALADQRRADEVRSALRDNFARSKDFALF